MNSFKFTTTVLLVASLLVLPAVSLAAAGLFAAVAYMTDDADLTETRKLIRG